VLSGMLLVRNTRLSTVPVSEAQAERLLELGATRV
jgi:predicted RNA-binding protein with PUA-like domain